MGCPLIIIRMKVRNYLFHRVSPERDILWDPMDPSHFEKCIKYINKKYNVLSIEELYLEKTLNKSKKPIATICANILLAGEITTKSSLRPITRSIVKETTILKLISFIS